MIRLFLTETLKIIGSGVIAIHEDVSVELDALLVDVSWTRIVAEVEKRMGLDALAELHH